MRFPEKLSGSEIASLMRKHDVTIRDLAHKMGVTMKRVREVRESGLDKLGYIRDWIEGIRGSLVQTFTIGLERHPEVGCRRYVELDWMKKFKAVNPDFDGVFAVKLLDADQWDIRLVWGPYRLKPDVFGVNPNQLWPGDTVKLDMNAWLGVKAKEPYRGYSGKLAGAIETHRTVKGRGFWGSGSCLIGGPAPSNWEGDEVGLAPIRTLLQKAEKGKRLVPKEKVRLDDEDYLKVGKEFLDWDVAQFFYRNAARKLTFARTLTGPPKKKVAAFVIYEGASPVGILCEIRPNPSAHFDGRRPFVPPKPAKASSFRSLKYAVAQKAA